MIRKETSHEYQEVPLSIIHVDYLIGMAFNLIGCVGVLPHTTDQRASEPVEQYGNGYRYEKNGWIYLHIQGEPYDRGYQHGYLVASELSEILRSLKYLTLQDTGME